MESLKAELKEYFDSTHDLFNSFVMVCPMLILYEFGLLYDKRGINGVDFFSFILSQFGNTAFIIFNLLLIALFIGAAIYLHKKERFKLNFFFGAVIESTLYATLVAFICTFIIREISTINIFGNGEEIPATTQLIRSFGAGVYEEMFFRLFLFGGLYALLKKIYDMDKAIAFIIACIVSSVLFSTAHFLGGGVATMYLFLYRFIAGVLFVCIYFFRSFAVAVYTHALYDIFVFIFWSPAE